MFVLWVLLGLLLVAGVAFVLASVGGELPDDPPDEGTPYVPTDRVLRSEDVPRLRFRRALLGYRQDDVDAALHAVYRTLGEAEGGADEAAERLEAQP